MTTLENRPNTAVLVVDVQNGVFEGAHERDAVVANVGSRVERAPASAVRGPVAGWGRAGRGGAAGPAEDQAARGAPHPDEGMGHADRERTYQAAPGRTAGTVERRDGDFGGTS